MLCAAIEFARNVVGLQGAHSSEFDKDSPHPVICLLNEQREITQMGGTMRLGTYPCKLKEGSKAYNAYGAAVVHERHRHRYDFNNKFKSQYEKHGMVFSLNLPINRDCMDC
jgi:CTP synthase